MLQLLQSPPCAAHNDVVRRPYTADTSTRGDGQAALYTMLCTAPSTTENELDPLVTAILVLCHLRPAFHARQVSHAMVTERPAVHARIPLDSPGTVCP
jgi:hypothetical protein